MRRLIVACMLLVTCASANLSNAWTPWMTPPMRLNATLVEGDVERYD